MLECPRCKFLSSTIFYFQHKKWVKPIHNQFWASRWPNLRTIFEYPPEIRKTIYTTNAIESLNSVICAATKRRKLFPNDDSAKKVVYLAIMQASKKWTMPIQNWKMALNRFILEFGERITIHHP